MPRGDRTGPWGAGPMTGRAAGYCAGYSVPGFMNPIGEYGRGWGRGRGRGFGRGGGRGFGRGWYSYPPLAVGQPAYPQAYPPVAQPQSPWKTIRKIWKQRRQTLNKKWVASKLESKN